MPKNALRPIVCTEPGCGYVYKHKRMDSKVWQSEHFRHRVTGECAARVKAFNELQTASRENGSGLTAADVTDMMVPIYELLRVQDAKHEALRARVEKRLESRRMRKPDYAERDSKPKPWFLGSPLGSIPQEAHPVQNFRDIMTKEYDLGWSWERALTQWFHWLLDQSCSDAVILMAKDEVRYHTKAGVAKTTKLRFFRCWSRTVKDWDPADEGPDAFFIGFWYPLIRACKRMVHWQNWIMFELPVSEQAKRHVEAIWHDDMLDARQPCLQRDSRIARVFYDVLVERKDRRRGQRMDDEKEQP